MIVEQIKKYSCFLTEKEDVVFVIPFIGNEDARDAKILYADGEHALFYKTETKMVVLDYLNESIRPFLGKVNQVFLLEVNLDTQCIIKNYFVPVQHVDNLPSFILESKTHHIS